MGLIKPILEAKESIGDLSNLVSSAYLKKQGFSENGFRFLAIEGNELTFAVPPQDDTTGEYAEKALFAIRHLSVGKVAPQIDGEDIHGKSFKLSDYRGKVIMLSFWGHW